MPGQKKASARGCFPVFVEKLPNGYWAVCPTLRSCFVGGLSYEETLANMNRKIVEEMRELHERGETVPPATNFSFTVMEVEV